MKKICYILVFVVGIVFVSNPAVFAFSQRGAAYYDKAIRYIKEKQHDFALMEFRTIIRDYPESKYARESLFAIGEYFYLQGAHYEAIRYFSEYIKSYPDSKAAIFAKAYLLKIIQTMQESTGGKSKIIEDIEMEFFSQPLFLLFSDYKEVSYKSTFRNKFEIRYYLDKIEVYRNDAPFLKITQ